MAYRNPVFYIWHELTNATTVTAATTPDSGSPALAYDYRMDEVAHWNSATETDGYTVTRTPISGSIYHLLDTMIVADSFSASGNVTVTVDSADDLAFTTGLVNHKTQLHLGGISGLQLYSLLSTGDTTSNAYVRAQWDLTSSDLDLGEVYLSEKREMSRGPDPGWDISSRSHQNDSTSMAGIDSSRITGASLKTFRLKWNALDGTDLDIIDDLLELAGTARPFYFTPPDTRYTLVMPCRLTRDPQIRQQRSNPSLGPGYEVTLDLIEVAG